MWTEDTKDVTGLGRSAFFWDRDVWLNRPPLLVWVFGLDLQGLWQGYFIFLIKDLWDSKSNKLKSWWQFLGPKTCQTNGRWMLGRLSVVQFSKPMPFHRKERLKNWTVSLLTCKQHQTTYLHVSCGAVASASPLFLFSLSSVDNLLWISGRHECSVQLGGRFFSWLQCFCRVLFFNFPSGKRYINICPTSICFTTSTVKR